MARFPKGLFMHEYLNRQLTELDRVFRLIRHLAMEHALAPDLEKDLCVVAEELFTNQVRHARPGGAQIEFRVDVEDGCVRMDLVDENVEPWDPTAAPEVDIHRPVEERRPGGLGIHFVRTLSDSFEWTYDPDRRTSRITVTRQLER
jgi:anti-sigma regulatory factor (Ser/Thr protein kinase)